MIINRLSELMGERRIKISKLSVDTGIARSTLTPIYYNKSEMIKIDTINKLCKYFQVHVAQFFESTFFDIHFEFNKELEENNVYLKRNDEGIQEYNFNALSTVTIEDLNSNKEIIHLNMDCLEDSVLIDTLVDAKGNGKFELAEKSELKFSFYFQSIEEEVLFSKYVAAMSFGMYSVLISQLTDKYQSFLIETLEKDDNLKELNRPAVKIEDLINRANKNFIESIDRTYGPNL